ncbi:MAG TPA: RNA polymerase sigma factor [Acidimicrobiales bacterium]|nr:RNA polymerase sigma factor [Acidimicrobiales bacterium]
MADDAELVRRLQAGDEAAFTALVERFHAPLLRLAMAFVPSRAVAEDVVQDTWIGVVRGIERFEGRSTLKTWLYRIALNRARSAGVKARRETPTDLARSEPAVPPHRFDTAGGWSDPPAAWAEDAEDRLEAKRTVALIANHLDEVPPAQRQVLLLRDFEGLPAAEVCQLLGITEANQRVLLHRGRSRIRSMVERERGKG